MVVVLTIEVLVILMYAASLPSSDVDGSGRVL